jgi:chromosome segregation ATPase
MELNQNRPVDRTAHPAAPRSLHGQPNVRRPMPPEETGRVAAIDLVKQAASVMQSIEDRAAETMMRAQELAQRAKEQLNFARHRIRELEEAQVAAEARCNDANARAEHAEQEIMTARAQMAAIGDRLRTTEDRAKNAEARAIEADRTLLRVEEALRTQLLARRPSLASFSAAAAAA